MGVYKRSGSAHWQIEFVYKGRPVRQSSRTGDKRLAERIEAELRASLVKQDQLGEIAPMTVEQAAKRYWDTVVVPGAANNLDSTAKSVRSRLLAISAHFGTGTLLTTIVAARVSEWKAALLATGMKPGSVDRSLDLLRSILYRAKDEWGALHTVPNIGKIKLKEDNARTRFLTLEEEDALLGAAEVVDHDCRDVIAFLLDTGGRRGDALQLTWDCVDFSSQRVRFEHTKEDKPRAVPMSSRVFSILSARAMSAGRVFPYDPDTCAHVRSRKGKLGAPKKDCRPGFIQAWKRSVKKAKLLNVHVHDLRHTFASRLVMGGVPLYDVGELLGHTDPATTARYSHLSPQAHRSAIAVLERARPAQSEDQTVRESQPER